MNYKKLIEERKSTRDYKKTTVPKEIIDEILQFSEETDKLIPGIETELLALDKSKVYEQLKDTAGYQGIMLEAPHYLIMLSEVRGYYIENAGYLGEKISLKALDLGTNTCWITFPESEKVKKRLFLNTDMEIVAIMALGYDANKSRVVNQDNVGDNYSKSQLKIVKNNVSTRYSIEDLVYIKEWGHNAHYDELENRGLLDALNYARLAPSTMNRQPWRFILDEEKVVLAIRDDENIREYDEKIDTGISMLYFESLVRQTLTETNWVLDEP
ncbi:MAG: nitroreductase family protein, partial [Tissierellales bacterium]|nr:nitroreductase family protein [Tissierellales bacterium]